MAFFAQTGPEGYGPLGAQLGQQLGQTISRMVPQPETIVQRKMLSDAFEKAKQSTQGKPIPGKPGEFEPSNPMDIMFNFIQATAGIPGAEKYVGQVLPMVMQYAQGLRGAQTPGPDAVNIGDPGTDTGEPQTGGIVQPTPTQGFQEQLPQSKITSTASQFIVDADKKGMILPAPDQIDETVRSGALEETEIGRGPRPMLYSPEAIKKLAAEDMMAGHMDTPQAKVAQQYNEMARAENQDIVKAAEAQAVLGRERAGRQSEFRSVLQSHIGTDEPFDTALAENISNRPAYRNIANDNIRAEKVSREYKLLQRNWNRFQDSSYRPNPYNPFTRSQYEKNFEKLHTNAKPLVDNGMRAQIYDRLIKNKWSQSEAEQITNPLEKSIKQKMEILPDLSPDRVTGFTPVMPGSVTAEREDKRMEKGLKKWNNFFKKNIEPGKLNPLIPDTREPGTSLVLLRNSFMEKGGNWEVYSDMINDLVATDQIKLDPYQQSEMNTINMRPFHSLSLEEFFWGIHK